MNRIDTGWRNGLPPQTHRRPHAQLAFDHVAFDLDISPQSLPLLEDIEEDELEGFSVAGPELQEALETAAHLRRRLTQQRELSLAQRTEVAQLREAAATAEQRAEALTQDLADVGDRLGAELDSVMKEKTYIAELLLEKSAALDHARGRTAFLEAALAAAETECERLTAEAAKAMEREEARATECKRREHDALARVAEAQARLARAHEEIQELAMKNAAGRFAQAEAVSKSAQLAQDVAALSAKERDAVMQAAATAERLARTERELRELVAGYESAERQIAAANLARANMAIDHERLQNQIVAQNARVAELEQAHNNKLVGTMPALTGAPDRRHQPLVTDRRTLAVLSELDHVGSQAPPPAAAGNEAHLATNRAERKTRTREQWATLLQQLDQLTRLRRQVQQPSLTSLLANTISYA